MKIAFPIISAKDFRQSWGLIGVSLYLFCLGLPLGELYSNILICLIAAIAVIKSNEFNIDKGKYVLFTLFSFLIATGFSTLGSVDFSRSLIINLSLFPAAVIFYVIVAQFSLRQVTLLLSVLVSMGACLNLVLIAAAFYSLSDDPTRWMSGASFTYLSTPNDLILVALIAPFSLVLMKTEQSRVLRLFSGFTLILSLSTVVIYRSNVALLTMVVEVAILYGFLWRKYFLAVLSLLLVMVVIGDGLQDFLLIRKMSDPVVWGNRMPLWLSANNMFLDAPLIGHGPGAFSVLSENYIQELSLPDWVSLDPRHVPWVHNLYLELLAERGIPGLVTFLAIAVVITKELLSIKSDNTKVSLYAVAILSSFCGLLLAGVFELSILRHWVLIFIATISAVTLLLVNHGRNQTEFED